MIFYIIKVSLVQWFLLLPYLFFRNDGNFLFNRFYLLFVMGFSLLLPAFEGFLITNSIEGLTIYRLDPVNVISTVNRQLPANYHTISLMLYGVVSGVLLLLVWIKIETVLALARKAEKIKSGDLLLLYHPKVKADFSFFNLIFLCGSSPPDPLIIRHEKIHSRQLHSLDVLLAEVYCVLNWLNPMAWWMKKEIMINHEFIVDHEMLKSCDKVSYKEMLLANAFHIPGNIIGSTFSYSKLKERFTMMNQTQQSKKRWKLFAVLPALVVITMGFGYASHQPITFMPFAANTLETQQAEKNPDVMPEYPGGMEAMTAYISKELKYPESARKENKSGKVMVSFVVDKQGRVGEVKLLKGFDPDCDAEALRVVKGMPKWTPGKKGDEIVAVEMILPLVFQLS